MSNQWEEEVGCLLAMIDASDERVNYNVSQSAIKMTIFLCSRWDEEVGWIIAVIDADGK